MLEAKCPNYGYHAYGWALLNPDDQTCPKCGARLEVCEQNRSSKESNQPDKARQNPKFR